MSAARHFFVVEVQDGAAWRTSGAPYHSQRTADNVAALARRKYPGVRVRRIPEAEAIAILRGEATPCAS